MSAINDLMSKYAKSKTTTLEELIVLAYIADDPSAEKAADELAAKDAALEAATVERDKLRDFAKEMIELADWPDGGDIDGFDFQDAAVKHGVLIPEQRTEPCGEGCACDQYYSDDEWKDGVTCYRLAAALSKAGDA